MLYSTPFAFDARVMWYLWIFGAVCTRASESTVCNVDWASRTGSSRPAQERVEWRVEQVPERIGWRRKPCATEPLTSAHAPTNRLLAKGTVCYSCIVRLATMVLRWYKSKGHKVLQGDLSIVAEGGTQ
jgi:hypothetical protein